MDIGLFTYFIAALVVAFLSTIPFGPINLTVAKITVDKSRRRGFEVAIAASIVEIFEALVAIFFGMMISDFLENNIFFRSLIATVFIGLAVFIYKRKPKEKLLSDQHASGSELKTGFVVSILNPQAIPFWIIALAAINEYATLTFDGINLTFFLIGVFVGKLLALCAFILISHYLQTHLAQSARLVNRILTDVLLLIGLSQWYRILFGA
jgi:threonine/homoserine/homoserine lactone efflux protein